MRRGEDAAVAVAEKQTSDRMRVATAWLGATAVHSRDPPLPALLDSIGELCDLHLQLSVLINLFDDTRPAVTGNLSTHPRIRST